MAARIVEGSAARGTGGPAGALPFGGVMATGAVSQLAGLAGLPGLRVPLLILAIVIAAVVSVRGAARAARHRIARPSLPGWLGLFTVPVGLAVIAAGGSATHFAGSLPAAFVVAALAAGAAVVVCAGAVRSAVSSPPALAAVNGVWFIAPAAFLAVAVASAGLGVHPGVPVPAVLAWIGVVSVSIGTAGYLALLVAAVLRVYRHGLAAAPKVAWWIVVGCGGLAALALGQVATTAGPFVPEAAPVFRAAALACAVTASGVLVPVTVGCARYLAGLPHSPGRAPWPPAFSSGVYALGAAEIGATFGWVAATVLARVAAVETLAAWVIIAVINVLAHLPRVRRTT